MDRASVFGTEGWGFESLRPGHLSLLAGVAAPLSGVERFAYQSLTGCVVSICVQQAFDHLSIALSSAKESGLCPKALTALTSAP